MNAEKIITELQQELRERIKGGAGPFLAAIYKPDGTLVAGEANSVLRAATRFTSPQGGDPRLKSLRKS